MTTNTVAEKILVLGVDGLDPSLTRKYMDQGLLPNIKKFVDRGAQRDDLVMLGALPTITPPLWTTLVTGTYPGTHGITCFWNQSHEDLSTMVYAFDSTKCHSEQLWNVFAEAGKKTLVWHWPGSSWPPTSDSPNLHVVDGVQPAAIGAGTSVVDWEKMIVANDSISELVYKPKISNNTGAGCIITDLPDETMDTSVLEGIASGSKTKKVTNVMLSEDDGELAIDKAPIDLINSPIKPATGWADAPAGALEFTMVVADGYVRRPCLILKNAQGAYDQVAIYRTKKEKTPLLTLSHDVLITGFKDDLSLNEEVKHTTRNIKLLDIAADGSHVRLWISCAYDVDNDHVWHPHTLYHDVVANVGNIPGMALVGATDFELVKRVVLPTWDAYQKWQSNCLNYLIETKGYDTVFSHIHNVDACGHNYWYLGRERAELGNMEANYQGAMFEIYRQTDEYLGSFYHLLDKGWTVLIVSDHGLLTTGEDHTPLIGDAFGCNVRVLEELGYTTLKKDSQGNDLKEIDWSQTKAVATRGGHIWINLKGRNATGIVAPEDKYDLEKQIISDLYSYRFHGERVITIAMRNKDAKLLGVYGEECGDIIYFLEEGFNRIHGDSLSTNFGYKDTSVSPIFIAAGPGLKKGFTTDRIIRQVDFAPTIATLGGVRMPRNCEGAPVYQILAD